MEKKRFKLEIKETWYNHGEFHVRGTAYTKDKIVENIECVMNYHEVIDSIERSNMRKLNRDYINKITD